MGIALLLVLRYSIAGAQNMATFPQGVSAMPPAPSSPFQWSSSAYGPGTAMTFGPEQVLGPMRLGSFIIRLSNKDRKYWSTLDIISIRSGDKQEFDIDVYHCKVHKVSILDPTRKECPGCSFTTEEVLEYTFCGSKEYIFAGTSDLISNTNYKYISLGYRLSFLVHACENGDSIDLIHKDDKIVAKCTRETCILCGSKIGGKEIVNFLRLKGGL